MEITHLQLDNITGQYRKACNWRERMDLAVTFFQSLLLLHQKNSCEAKQGLVPQVSHLDLFQITTEMLFQQSGYCYHKLLNTTLFHQKSLWKGGVYLNVDNNILKNNHFFVNNLTSATFKLFGAALVCFAVVFFNYNIFKKNQSTKERYQLAYYLDKHLPLAKDLKYNPRSTVSKRIMLKIEYSSEEEPAQL